MDQRLQAIYERVRPGVGVIDVGTDHALLPVRLAQTGYPGRIFASDLREGPLSAARRSAGQAGVSDRIRFLLSDGLEACPHGAVDTIVIAGMGGDLICGILDRAEWCWDSAYRFLLQPMTKPEVLRYFLSNNGFRIEDEALAEDDGTVYQIIEAVFCGVNERLSDLELRIGKRGLADPRLYRRLLDQEAQRILRRIEGLTHSSAPDRGRQLAVLRRRLEEIVAMREQS